MSISVPKRLKVTSAEDALTVTTSVAERVSPRVIAVESLAVTTISKAT
jgi:hypothetical protein